MRISNPFVACTIVFVASFCSLVIKLSLLDLNRTGNIVGRIYAVSTVGAIVGTFATGFYLIELLGTRQIVWVVGLVLLFMGLLVGQLWRTPPRGATVGAAVVLV